MLALFIFIFALLAITLVFFIITYEPSQTTNHNKLPPQQITPPLLQLKLMCRRLWAFGKWIVLFVVPCIGVLSTLDQVWGPVWPTAPKIEFHDAIDASSFVLPFKTTNQSVLFRQNSIPIYSNIDEVFLVDTAGTFARFAGLQFRPPPVSLDRAGVINYKFAASEYIRVKDDRYIEIGFENYNSVRTSTAIFPKPPVIIATMCVRISGFYNGAGFSRPFTSNTFQWPAAPGQNQWLEGRIAPDLPSAYQCPR